MTQTVFVLLVVDITKLYLITCGPLSGCILMLTIIAGGKVIATPYCRK